ncbi:glutathione ABC transporter substrate-binding protein [Lentibacillus sediminis]|uniref:glutathione ABC transporter substrate-binding protein n=1 Tax=Lentibacillus sediminis TaxID=1940529 RepID=UPI000C1B9EAB|nr:glutathione ABC transporter substrate-binding protein [Lentibacillus sediminis]
MSKFLKAILFASLLLILAACASEPGSENASGETSGENAGETLIIATQADATMLDPHLGTDIPSANIFHNKIFETLVKQDENMEFQPGLATEWERVDETTWEFTLREGVEFHDGEPFNAEAVKANLERVVNEDLASPRASLFNMISEIEVVDDYKIRLITEYPYSPMLSNLAHYAGGMISPAAIEEHASGGTTVTENPVGTGPFVFESWTPGSELNLTTNDSYWGEAPSIAGVQYLIIPEAQTRISMVETGDAHIAEPVTTSSVSRIEGSDVMEFYNTEGLGVDYMGMNVQKEPFDDKLVRQAVNHAIDMDALIEHVYNGVGIPAEGPIGPAVFGHDPELEGYEHNPEKAKELLAEAGFPDGFETTISTNDDQARRDAAEFIQSQLSEVGIEATIEVMEWGAYLEATAAGDHEMFILGWSNMTGDGDYNQYYLYHSDSLGPAGNRAFYSNPEVDALIDEARSETDQEARAQLYSEVQQIEVEDAPLALMRHVEHIAAVHESVEGFWMHPSGILMLDGVTIE